MITRSCAIAFAAFVAALSGCTTTSQTVVAISTDETDACQTGDIVLDTDFPAGKVATCKVTGPISFTVTIEPEDQPPINCSAWYAFRLTPKTATATRNVSVDLKYEHCGHRYWPKTSLDGVTWTYLPKTNVSIVKTGDIKQAKISVSLDDKPKYVSAQEIIVPETYNAWIARLAESPAVGSWLLGKSAEKRNIYGITIKKPGAEPKKQVVLVGRQHPPEITGALGMLTFVETLNDNSVLATKYRTRFETVVVPMLNPDGVVRGHWRHNTGGTDLNRDWGPFKQPETQLMDGLLKEIEANSKKQLVFFADFHSTQNDIFYTIPDELETTPKLFIKKWLGLLQRRMPEYEVRRSENANLTQANSKNYVYRTYGVPTVTYEMGDETDRELIRKIAREAAIAMMETLLASSSE